MNMLIRALVITAAVLCADETPIRVGPGPKTRKKYLLVACTSLLTYYFLGDRSMKTLRRVRVPGPVRHASSCTTGTRTTTRSPACCTSCAPSTSCATWRTPPSRTRTRSGPARPRTRCAPSSTPRTPPGTRAWPPSRTTTSPLTCVLFRNAVRVGLSEVRRVPGANSKQKPGRMLLECLQDREADVLRFLTDLRIPPTSNQAERDLRPSKTQQKISGRLRSETATRNRYAIRGYLDTARKHARRRHHRHPRRPRRKPLDAAHPRMSTAMPTASHTTQ